MYIRHSTIQDLPEMRRIYKAAKAFMVSYGNAFQWGDDYLTDELLLDDIEKGYSYVAVESGPDPDAMAMVCPDPDAMAMVCPDPDAQAKSYCDSDAMAVSDLDPDARAIAADTDREPQPCRPMSEPVERIVGTFVFIIGPDPTYAEIDGAWLDDTKVYGTIHRIGSDLSVPGVMKAALDMGFGKVDSIRVDTHEKNAPMRHLMDKYGFTYCGTIICSDGTPRMAFQKIK